MKKGWKQPPRTWTKKDCAWCGKTYTPVSSSQQTCSEDCSKLFQAKQVKLKKEKREEEFLGKYFLDGKGFLKKQLRKRRLKVTDERVIDYDSPTGKAYIGIAKTPLQKVDKGFGYKGVLIQTDNRTLVQCHLCGKWFRSLGSHIRKLHKMEQREYCKEFGLNETKGLVSDDKSYSLEKNARALWQKTQYRAARIRELRKRQPKAIKAFLKKKDKKDSIEEQNKTASCELQIQYRLVEYIKHFKDLPSRSIKGEGGRICKVLYHRYGSVNEGFKHYGLPVRYRTGTSVELVSPDKAQYFFNYNKQYNKNDIYQWMKDHCPILNEVNTLPTKESV